MPLVTEREAPKTSRLSKYIKPNLEDNHVIQRVPKQNEEIAEKTRQKEE